MLWLNMSATEVPPPSEDRCDRYDGSSLVFVSRRRKYIEQGRGLQEPVFMNADRDAEMTERNLLSTSCCQQVDHVYV